MPAYELFVIIRNLDRPALIQSIKRSADQIIKRNGMIRSFENLGHKPLPYKIKANGANHTTGNYMLIKFDLPRDQVQAVGAELKKDADYIRSGITNLVEYDEEYQADCRCAEKGEFAKLAFNFDRPMTSWDKKRVYKNYGLRL